MAKKYLDYDGLLYFWQKIKTVFVPTTRKVNGKALSADITLSASDVSALPSSTTIPAPGTGSSYPAMDGTRALGTNAGYARVDHVHPTDSTRAPIASPEFTGTPKAPTPSSGDDSTRIATTEFVLGEIDDALGSFNVGVTDVKIDSSSIVTQGIANIPTASTSAKGLMTTAQVTKLNGIQTGAEVNQNAFGEITVDIGGVPITIAATEESDEVTFTPGSNVTFTADDTNKTITIAATDTTYSVVTAGTSTTSGGLMSQADKSKLNGIASGAEVNQNAFSNVKVGSTTVAADGKTDTLELAGSNVTLTPDATNDKVTIGITASNVTTALGNTAVARATGDASGNNIANTYAPKASPTFSGTPIAPTAAAGTNTQQIATTAFVTSAVQTAITGAAAFQGTAPTSFAPTNYKKGYYWVVGTAGTYAGQVCEPGDMIFAVKDYASAYAASDFNVIQTNLDITSITNAEIDTILAA